MAGLVSDRRLRYFSRVISSDATLQILLVSTSQEYLEKLANNLFIVREVQMEKRTYHLKVHTCKNIIDVLENMPEEMYVDYIIFVLETTVGNCLTDVENNLSWIDSSFTREKICVVNPNATYVNTMVSPREIWDFVRQHQFNLVNGQIKDQNGLFNLSKKILNLSEACCGIINGVPMINIV